MSPLPRRILLLGVAASLCGTGGARAAPLAIYIAENGQTLGPFDEAALKSRIRSRAEAAQTLVWHQGLAGWTKATDVPALAAFLASLPAETPLDSSFLVGIWRSRDVVVQTSEGALFGHATWRLNADDSFTTEVFAEHMNIWTRTEPALQPGMAPGKVIENQSHRVRIEASGTYSIRQPQPGVIEIRMKGTSITKTQSGNDPQKSKQGKMDHATTFTVLGPDHMRTEIDENFHRQAG